VGIGLDYGTSNSAAAVFDGRQVHIVQLESSNAVTPSACYIRTEFSVETGERAIHAYIEENRGRRVELSAQVVGEARLSTGQIDDKTSMPTAANTSTIYGREVHDRTMPGRFFFGVKRLLGNATAERVSVFGRPFRLVALVTPILKQIFAATMRTPVRTTTGWDHGCIGHPVQFEGDSNDRNRVAITRLCEAYRHAGIVRQSLCPEPIAAAVSYLQKAPISKPFRALTVDFGGGTLDLCVIRQRSAKIEVEAVHGIALGGDKIDQAIFRELIFPLLGKGEHWIRMVDSREVDTEFPFWRYEERLLNWQVSYTLNQNEFLTPVLAQTSSVGERGEKFRRLYELITSNSVFEVFQAIKKAKETLSTESEAVIDIAEIDLSVTLDRARFESIISVFLDQFGKSIDEILESTGLEHSEIDIVIRTGGSALIPAFSNLLDSRFPAKVVEHDPFTGVAAGLAIADYYGIGAPREGE
jgi:hypothetical chaperone protein